MRELYHLTCPAQCGFRSRRGRPAWSPAKWATNAQNTRTAGAFGGPPAGGRGEDAVHEVREVTRSEVLTEGDSLTVMSAKKGRSSAAGKKKETEGFASREGLTAVAAFSKSRPSDVTPLFVVLESDYRTWLESAPEHLRLWLSGIDFKPSPGASAILPGDSGPEAAVVVVSTPTNHWEYAGLPKILPARVYDAEPDLETDIANALCLGWALGSYRYERYKGKKTSRARLVWPEAAQQARVLAISEAIYFARDLITTPASDMGPEELADEAKRLAKHHGARFAVTVGDDLLEEDYPMIHAVGRASSRAPRLVDISWGKSSSPLITLVGKGVCFDTGGLDLKPAQYMLLMKKDMGGAALVLALGHAIMSLGLPLRLRILVPAVENSVSGNALRPLDVLTSRAKKTVEVGDTDAEGRLVLADALFEAAGEKPTFLMCAATLTGAARVALGTSMPAIFANKTETWQELERSSQRAFDPLWRLPLYEPYRKKLESKVADLSSTGDQYGGAITAALFLREFVGQSLDWVHMDTMAYNIEASPGRPVGGEAQGLLALLGLVEGRLG
jgi:leucyl aminopeptidase